MIVRPFDSNDGDLVGAGFHCSSNEAFMVGRLKRAMNGGVISGARNAASGIAQLLTVLLTAHVDDVLNHDVRLPATAGGCGRMRAGGPMSAYVGWSRRRGAVFMTAAGNLVSSRSKMASNMFRGCFTGPAKPLVLIEAWNELQEGSFILPTVGAGYKYSLAVASAVGIQWASAHSRTLTLALQGRVGSGSVTVADGWSDCRLASVVISRRVRQTWQRIASVRSRPDGQFSFALAKRRGVYQASVAHTTTYGQVCGAARSAVVSAGSF